MISRRIVAGPLFGTSIMVVGMKVVEEMFWVSCDDVDIHRYREIWMCWNFVDILSAVAAVAGFVAGFWSRRRGVVNGVLVVTSGLVLYSLLFRHLFGNDHLATLRNGLMHFVLPGAVAGLLGARLSSGSWKNAL